MESTTFLQDLADNWLVVGIMTFYLGAILWTIRPGSRKVHEDISQIPFRNDTITSTSTEAK